MEYETDEHKVRNNNLYSCKYLYVSYRNACNLKRDTYSICNLDELNNYPDSAANISVDPVFANVSGDDSDINTMLDNNWRLSASSPEKISGGGIIGLSDVDNWVFTTDMDGKSRTSVLSPGWSIGAYEP